MRHDNGDELIQDGLRQYFLKDLHMLTQVAATISLFFLAGSGVAGTLDACDLLSHQDRVQLQVPNDATATSRWSEKDGENLCRYALGDSFKLLVEFGKTTDENIRKIETTLNQMKTAAQKNIAMPQTAFDESSMCLNSALPQGRLMSCLGFRKDVRLSLNIIRSASDKPKEVSPSALLQIFDNILSKLKI